MSESETVKTCELCGSPDVEFGRLCYVCKGAPKYPLSVVPDAPEDLNTPELRCASCGGPFEPYQVGIAWVKKPGNCKLCLMKKKYGKDWNFRDKNERQRLWRAKKKMEKQNGGKKKSIDPKPAPLPTETPNESTPNDMLSVLIPFEGKDEDMYYELIRICTKERRSIQQQILFYLDRILKEANDG